MTSKIRISEQFVRCEDRLREQAIEQRHCRVRYFQSIDA